MLRTKALLAVITIITAISGCRLPECEDTEGTLSEAEQSFFYAPNTKVVFKLVGANVYDTLEADPIDPMMGATIPDEYNCTHKQVIASQFLRIQSPGSAQGLYLNIPHVDEWHDDINYYKIVCLDGAEYSFALGTHEVGVTISGVLYTHVTTLHSTLGNAGEISTIYFNRPHGILKYVKPGVGTFEKVN